MGIPRLAGHLQPYSVNVTLGHKTNGGNGDVQDDPTEPSKLIIDGPGLAYYIYYRLLANRSGFLNAFDAAPSYREIGTAFVGFLGQLETHHVEM